MRLEAGIWCLALIVLMLFGRWWFYLVEGILERIKFLLNPNRKPPIWHPFDETDREKDSRK